MRSQVAGAQAANARGICVSATSMLVGPGRLELPTSRLSGVRSNQAELRAYGRTTALSSRTRIRDRLAIAHFITPRPNVATL